MREKLEIRVHDFSCLGHYSQSWFEYFLWWIWVGLALNLANKANGITTPGDTTRPIKPLDDVKKTTQLHHNMKIHHLNPLRLCETSLVSFYFPVSMAIGSGMFVFLWHLICSWLQQRLSITETMFSSFLSFRFHSPTTLFSAVVVVVVFSLSCCAFAKVSQSSFLKKRKRQQDWIIPKRRTELEKHVKLFRRIFSQPPGRN